MGKAIRFKKMLKKLCQEYYNNPAGVKKKNSLYKAFPPGSFNFECLLAGHVIYSPRFTKKKKQYLNYDDNDNDNSYNSMLICINEGGKSEADFKSRALDPFRNAFICYLVFVGIGFICCLVVVFKDSKNGQELSDTSSAIVTVTVIYNLLIIVCIVIGTNLFGLLIGGLVSGRENIVGKKKNIVGKKLLFCRLMDSDEIKTDTGNCKEFVGTATNNKCY
jgi:hypothetical protein